VNKWFSTDSFSHGVHNLTPGESFELCEQGAIIVDVREDYLNAFKMFKVEKVIYLLLSRLKDHYKDLPDDKHLIFADAIGLRSYEGVLLWNKKRYSS